MRRGIAPWIEWASQRAAAGRPASCFVRPASQALRPNGECRSHKSFPDASTGGEFITFVNVTSRLGMAKSGESVNQSS